MHARIKNVGIGPLSELKFRIGVVRDLKSGWKWGRFTMFWTPWDVDTVGIVPQGKSLA